ncbi:MAG TPA: Ig-like domain-containing protein, partial [Spirochaetia bacterium]|nr:Ig-like domain-containing protein [Spirochaetia bacterium]
MRGLCRLLAALVTVVALLSACGFARTGAPARSVAVPALYTPSGDDPKSDQKKGQSFQIAETGPSGTVPHENLEGGVWVLFTQPVVALKKLERPLTASSVLSISPRVDGTFRWYGSRLLAFEPKGQLAPATEYAVSVSKSLHSLEGETITGDTDFTFRTEPLGIVALSPQGTDVIPEASKEIVITFNFPVDLKTIVPSLRLEADGTAVRFTASRPVIKDRRELGPYEKADRLVSLKPAGELPRDSDVKVILLRGAKPRPENYGTAEDIAEVFHTLQPLELESSNVETGGPTPTAVLRFNHALAEDSVLPNLKVPLKGYSAENHVEISGSWVYVSQLPVPFESTFEIQLLRGMKDVYGQALGKD